MILARLYLTTRVPGRDDIIDMETSDYADAIPDMVKLTYTPHDLKKTTYTFQLSRRRVLSYVRSVLDSLALDTDPFEQVQVTTAISPSVMYHVSDMSNRDILDNIETILDTVLQVKVDRSAKKA